MEGFGVMSYPDKLKVYEGEFKNGLREGYGIFKWRSDSNT
jgi:hypothetical protein